MAFGRVLIKLIAVLQLIVFGRILGPDVVAIYAVAALVLSIVEMLTEQGLNVALIQKQEDITPYLSTVWSVNVFRGVILAVCLVLTSGWLAAWFNSHRSQTLIAAIGLVPLVRGFENLAEVTYSKALDFRRLVLLELAASVFGIFSGLAWLALGGGVSSLVVVAIMTSATRVIGSYYIMPTFHGWGFSLKRYRQLQRYGFWVMLSRYAAVGLTKGGAMAIGTLVNPLSLSYYQYADQLATSATMEISKLTNRVALPVFSRSQGDRAALAQSFERAFSMIGFVSLLCMSLLIGNAQQIVSLLLGEAWGPVASLVPWIALWGVTRALGACITYGLMAVGKPHAATIFQWTMLGLFAIGVYPVAKTLGAQGVCVLLAGIGLIVQFFRYPMVSRELGVPVGRLFGLILVPATAAALSALLNVQVIQWLSNAPVVFSLCIGLLVNCGVFLLLLMGAIVLFPHWVPIDWRSLGNTLVRRLGSR